uniref:Uncharacterized protein n=1 Tax=Eutreptiella gymnastica TaxID=73025 RepID=A0A7S1NGH6_9EUGL
MLHNSLLTTRWLYSISLHPVGFARSLFSQNQMVIFVLLAVLHVFPCLAQSENADWMQGCILGTCCKGMQQEQEIGIACNEIFVVEALFHHYKAFTRLRSIFVPSTIQEGSGAQRQEDRQGIGEVAGTGTGGLGKAQAPPLCHGRSLPFNVVH